MLIRFTTVFTLIAALALSACGGDSPRVGGTPPPPPSKTLSSIAVTPGGASVPAGLTQQFTATGTYSDATTSDITSTVTWSSSAPAIATIGATSGIAKSIAPGSAVITATSGAFSGSVTLTTTDPVVTSLSITPNPLQGWVGTDVSLSVLGTYSDGATKALSVVWTSSATSVGTIIGAGVIHGVAVGTTTVTATSGSVTATATVNIAANPWSATGSMSTARFSQPALALADGTILVAGGLSSHGLDQYPLASSEIYDPVPRKWVSTGDMTVPRVSHTVTLLADGTVLAAGGDIGIFSPGPFASTEIYNPASGVWTAAGNLATARIYHTATRLPNGSVLVAGGESLISPIVVEATAEIYDPAAHTWSATESMSVARAGHGATLLPNGKVLLAGGDSSTPSAEIYDPATGHWAATGSPVAAIDGSTATLLKDGTVLVLGDGTAEIYDPAAGTWKATGNQAVNLASLPGSRQLALRGDGTVLAVGASADQLTLLAEVYDPVAGAWAATAGVPHIRSVTLTSLGDGSVLMSGGISYQDVRLQPATTAASIFR